MPSSPDPHDAARAALVVAHPGHELRVHGWLEEAAPVVCVLTDGSGRTRRSRLGSTTRVLGAAGASVGPIYGAMTDAELYASLLDRDHSKFKRVVDELAAVLVNEKVRVVVGDAEEGYNPGHDVCHLLTDAAVRLVRRESGRRVESYDFTLVAPPALCPEALREGSIWHHLDAAAYARKLSAARNYPELHAEVEAALRGAGSAGLREHPDLAARSDFGGAVAYDFSVECLRPSDSPFRTLPFFNGARPFYEEYGERQVAAGHYARVLRYREHVLPLAAALDAHVNG